MIEHRTRASSKKQLEGLIDAKMDAVSSQNLRKATATQYLAVDQHAVAVENNEIGLGHRIPPARIRSYTHPMGNNPGIETQFLALCVALPMIDAWIEGATAGALNQQG
jgi:hypothetical protein